ITQVFHPAVIPLPALSKVANAFFVKFIIVQFAAVALLAPASTGPAIAEEKERGTLDYLFATDLRGYDLILGKLVSRLAYLVLFLLTGLPVLGLLQFLGGVDPSRVVAGYLATGMIILSLASLGLLNSALTGTARTATLLTYLEVLIYAGLCHLN